MNICCGVGIYVDTARFLPTNNFFKESNKTEERTTDCYEMVLFLRDGGAAVINGKKYPVKAGSVRFHRPGDRVYSYRFHEIYVLHFTVDDAQKGDSVFADIPPFITLPDMEKEIALFQKLIAAWIGQNDFECMCCLWGLLGRIREQFQIQEKHNQKQTVFQIREYIEANCHKQLTLEHIAHRFHMHPIYIQRKFKKETGVTPAEYQKKMRISKAIIYLRTTDLTVEEISELCGFCNASHFISVFQKSESMTPFQYRQQYNLHDILL